MSAKHEQDQLTPDNFNSLLDSIINRRNDEGLHTEISINISHSKDGIFICLDLFSFVWLVGVTMHLRIDSKELKLSTIDEISRITFYAGLPVDAITHNLLTYHIPINNSDIDPAKWRITYLKGDSVLFTMDLLSACILLYQQFRIHLRRSEYDLALIVKFKTNIKLSDLAQKEKQIYLGN